jgi:hypothetical protein
MHIEQYAIKSFSPLERYAIHDITLKFRFEDDIILHTYIPIRGVGHRQFVARSESYLHALDECSI